MLENCAGLDVHQSSVVVCIMTGSGKNAKKELKKFGTMTDDIRNLGTWLKDNSIQDVAMESTGIYWVPIVNILEGEMGFNIALTNAKQIKNVLGKKTDIKDAQWICELFKYGLIAKSFIASREIRRIRSLSRYRKSLIEDAATAKNRIIKTLEACNVKIASVISNVFCDSGRKIIQAIANNECRPDRLVKLVNKNARVEKTELIRALTGTFEKDDCIELRLKLEQLSQLEQAIAELDYRIERLCAPYEAEIELIPILKINS